MTNLPTSRFTFPQNVRFGHGEIRRLPECLAVAGFERPLLLTDAGMLRTNAFRNAREALDGAGLDWGLYSEVLPNPTEANVEAAAETFRKENRDGLIGFGGGSAMDAAKAVAIRLAHEGPLRGYTPPEGPSPPLAPVIAIPTTAGTGSEVGRAAVIVLAETGEKEILFDPRLMPTVALIDPDLTLELPPPLTAATGMDAFTHCLESYVSPAFHPFADAMALAGLELAVRYLPRATADGSDRAARGYMMFAAMMGALAFQKDLGAAHSMAHPLSTLAGVHHGLANAVVLPHTMRFNLEAARSKYARVAAIFDPTAGNLPEDRAAELAVLKVTELVEELGIPLNLGAVGVSRDLLGALAEAALKDPCHATNPRPCTLEDFQGLFTAAFGPGV